MRRIQYVAALALFCVVASAVHADTVEMGRSESSRRCFDWIKITRSDGCEKMIIKDCDDPNPCNWKDLGWDCNPGGGGGSVLPGGTLLPSAYDPFGNLVCDVASGQGGVFTPHQQDGVCFTAGSGTTLTISAQLLSSFQ